MKLLMHHSQQYTLNPHMRLKTTQNTLYSFVNFNETSYMEVFQMHLDTCYDNVQQLSIPCGGDIAVCGQCEL